MKMILYSAQTYDRLFFERVGNKTPSAHGLEISYTEAALSLQTVSLASGHGAICAFVNDSLDADVLENLAALGIRFVLMRCAGFNNVDLVAAQRLGIKVARVPAYSPEAVAEHALALIMTLNRHTHRAYNRVREGNFALDGLLGFNMHGKTVGLIGTGKIGMALARILHGFGCKVLASDPSPAPSFPTLGTYVSLERLLGESDIVSLHCPLDAHSKYLIDRRTLSMMKPGAMLINTSRGALVDTAALIEGLQSRRLGALGIDVYEQEGPLFFEDHSLEILDDELFQRLASFPNVLITGHQGFFTGEAMTQIASITLDNLRALARTGECANLLSP